MPSEAWYLLIACGAIVVVVALWKGRGLKIQKDSISIDPTHDAPKAGISIANRAHIVNSDVGDVTGISVSGQNVTTTPEQKVDVLNAAKLSGAHVGKVTGVARDGGSK